MSYCSKYNDNITNNNLNKQQQEAVGIVIDYNKMINNNIICHNNNNNTNNNNNNTIIRYNLFYALKKILKDQTTINLNIIKENDYTPLMIAVNHYSSKDFKLYGFSKPEDPINLLLERNNIIIGNNNSTDNNNNNNNNNMINIQRNHNGDTALHLACRDNKVQVIQLLLNHGANPFIENHSGLSAINECFRFNKNLETLRILFDTNTTTNNTNLIHHICNTKNGETLLHIACQYSYYDHVNFLLERGANVNAQDNQGRTPLHAIFWRYGLDDLSVLKCIQILLQYNVNVNMKNHNNETAILHAVEIIHHDDPYELQCLQMLLDANADITIQQTIKNMAGYGRMGDTILHIIIKKNFINATKLLLQYCTSMKHILIKNRCKKTPYDIAIKLGNVEIIKCMKDKMIEIRSETYHYLLTNWMTRQHEIVTVAISPEEAEQQTNENKNDDNNNETTKLSLSNNNECIHNISKKRKRKSRKSSKKTKRK